jgi:hypothetical protein
MSFTKRALEEGWRENPTCKQPLLEVGRRFFYNLSNIKITHGTWEIVSNERAPFYKCKRVLKSGKLSSSKSLENLREFYEIEIYRTFK